MKYIDASFHLFHELVKRTDSLVAGDVRRHPRLALGEAGVKSCEFVFDWRLSWWLEGGPSV